MAYFRGSLNLADVETKVEEVKDQYYQYTIFTPKVDINLNYNIYHFHATCFLVLQNTCPNDFRKIDIFYRQVTNDRRVYNFDTFVHSTNEKAQTKDVSSALLENYIFKFSGFMKKINVVDLGVGEGTLAGLVASNLKGQCEELNYEGIDREKKFIEKTTKLFLTLEIKKNKFIVGDCFGGDVDQLVDHPTILIASQVVFYASNVTNFIDSIVRKMGAIAFVIGQADFSFLNRMNKKYAGSYKQKDVELKIKNALDYQSKNVVYSNILYSSYIDFPKIDNLTKIATACYDCLIDSAEIKARQLMESMCGTSMEFIQYNNKLDNYITDIQAMLKRMDGQAIFWNFMGVVVPKEFNNEERLQESVRFIYKRKFSGSLIEMNKAIIEGSTDALRGMLKSGIVVPEITEKKTINLVEKFLMATRVFFLIKSWRGEKEFSNQDREKFIKNALENLDIGISELLWDNIEENIESPNIENIYHEMERLVSYTSQEGIKANAAGLILIRSIYMHIRLAYNTILAADFLQLFDVVKYHLWFLTNYCAQIVEIYLHSNTEYVLAHSLAAEGKTKIFKLTLPYMGETLNKQSGVGKTALHYALENNNTEIAKMILSANQTKINIRDNRGYLPIHYVAISGNNKMLKYFLDERGVKINELSESSSLSFIYNIKKNTLLSLMFMLSSYDIGDYRHMDHAFLGRFLRDLGMSLKIQVGAQNALLIKTNMPEVSFLPAYAKEELIADYFPTNQLKKDSLLDLAAKNKQTATALFLLERGINITINTDGVSAVHIAAANNDVQIIKAISLRHPDQIKHMAHMDSSYLANSLLLLVTLSVITFPNLVIANLLEGEFRMVLRYLVGYAPIMVIWCGYCYYFKPSNFYGKDYGNALHFAASGSINTFDIATIYFNKAYRDSRNLTEEKDGQKLETLKLLVEQGTELDHSLKFEMQILKPFENGMYFSIFYYRDQAIYIAYSYAFLGMFLLKWLYNSQIYPIDLVEKYVYNPINNATSISESYKFLKQYTSIDLVVKQSFFEYLLNIVGLKSKNDVIYITEYGAYYGGEGKDKFIITKNFAGKEEGLKVIIKNYQAGEEIKLDESFGNLEVSEIQYLHHKLINLPATTLLNLNGEEILTLMNYESNEVNVKTSKKESGSWWQFFFPQKPEIIQLINRETVYKSTEVGTIFRVTKKGEFPYKIMYFDCDQKNQKIDFRSFANIERLIDLRLLVDSTNENVIVVDEKTDVVYVELHGTQLDHLSKHCFFIGNQDDKYDL